MVVSMDSSALASMQWAFGPSQTNYTGVLASHDDLFKMSGTAPALFHLLTKSNYVLLVGLVLQLYVLLAVVGRITLPRRMCRYCGPRLSRCGNFGRKALKSSTDDRRKGFSGTYCKATSNALCSASVQSTTPNSLACPQSTSLSYQPRDILKDAQRIDRASAVASGKMVGCTKRRGLYFTTLGSRHLAVFSRGDSDGTQAFKDSVSKHASLAPAKGNDTKVDWIEERVAQARKEKASAKKGATVSALLSIKFSSTTATLHGLESGESLQTRAAAAASKNVSPSSASPAQRTASKLAGPVEELDKLNVEHQALHDVSHIPTIPDGDTSVVTDLPPLKLPSVKKRKELIRKRPSVPDGRTVESQGNLGLGERTLLIKLKAACVDAGTERGMSGSWRAPRAFNGCKVAGAADDGADACPEGSNLALREAASISVSFSGNYANKEERRASDGPNWRERPIAKRASDAFPGLSAFSSSKPAASDAQNWRVGATTLKSALADNKAKKRSDAPAWRELATELTIGSDTFTPAQSSSSLTGAVETIAPKRRGRTVGKCDQRKRELPEKDK